MKQHVFISYSRQDTAFVEKLITDLKSANIPYWIDRKGIRHSDSSFEREIRDAIKDSFAAVLFASPNSLESDYVQGEIDIILEHEIPLTVLWVRGDYYTDTVPTKLTRRSYIDARKDAYEKNKQSALTELLDLRDGAIPKISLSEGKVPACCFSVILPDTQQVVVRPDAYETFGQFLMDLYTDYLSNVFPPFSYGKTWVIAHTDDRKYAKTAMTPAILENKDKAWYQTPIEAVGLGAGGSTYIRALDGQGLFVIAVNRDSDHANVLEGGAGTIIEKYSYGNYHPREEYSPEKIAPCEKDHLIYIVATSNQRLKNMILWVRN